MDPRLVMRAQQGDVAAFDAITQLLYGRFLQVAGDDAIECARVLTRRVTCIFDGEAGDDRLHTDPQAGARLQGE